MRGRVNHVGVEEAQDAPDVILGMFVANSHPATILFDCGASHSFIATQFVARFNLPMSMMKNKMIVSSPGGDMLARHLCSKISIIIRGVEFLSNLIVLESKGLDIILGMDWLSKYNGVIDCAKKMVSVRGPGGKIVEYQAVPSNAPEARLNQINAVAEIKMVNEFPDVFPEELPGMPPDREIEFVIELVPGTAPIYKRPYRMDANQLAELKDQIQKLLDKGYICPSTSSWGAPVFIVPVTP